VLGVHNVVAGGLAGSEGASDDDKALLDCLQRVSCARVLGWLTVLS
jgi:hypothetical protein